jgi:hypothetical protein
VVVVVVAVVVVIAIVVATERVVVVVAVVVEAAFQAANMQADLLGVQSLAVAFAALCEEESCQEGTLEEVRAQAVASVGGRVVVLAVVVLSYEPPALLMITLFLRTISLVRGRQKHLGAAAITLLWCGGRGNNTRSACCNSKQLSKGISGIGFRWLWVQPRMLLWRWLLR